MKKELQRWIVAVPAVALVVLLTGSFLTRGAMSTLPFLRGQGGVARGGVSGLVDQRPWQTVEALAPLAVSAEEQRMAREAERLADHEVDQAFAMALRQASLETRVLTGDALALQQKVAGLQELVKEDQVKVDSLTGSLKGANGVVADSDDLDIAKAQLQLEKDELGDATEDLARVSGDKRGQIQQELTTREAAMKKFDDNADSGAQTAVVSSKRYSTLAGRVAAWFDQRSRMDLIAQAQAQADADVAALTKQHAEIEQKSSAASAAMDVSAGAPPVSVPSVLAPAGTGSSLVKGRVARMAQVHALAQVHSILDDRLDTQKQLSAVYGRWQAQVGLQHRIVTHLILQSLAGIAFLLLVAALLGMGIRRMLERSVVDKRRLQTLQTISSLGVQLLTLLLVLLIVFGAGFGQVATVVGLATAGLTVVFQDFILAFFGWFVLMGRNGIRVGDWVEINGVGGEVVEIGLFRTTLLETGNWTDKGHPTGRRVTFVNKYAISGQYFNFSTAGQWMWDELTVNIPPGEETYKTIEAIHAVVIKETEKDADLAEEEWHRSAKQHVLTQFSAKPSVDMRPAGAGIDIIVRYVTRAGDRFDMRNRLYQSVIDLLHRPATAATLADGTKA